MRKAQGDRTISLDVKFYFRPKQVDGKPAFVWWDKNENVEKAFSKAISGVYIGSAMRLSAFSPELGPKGNRYFSRPYWSLDNISLFEPTRSRAKLVMSGNMEEVVNFLNVHARGNIQKKKLLYLATEGGLIMVETNISICIDQLKNFERDTFLDYQMVLQPRTYHAEDENVSDQCKEHVLGSFALKNPPTYASISQGDPVTDDLLNDWGVENLLDNFLAWKDHVLKNEAAGAEGSQESDVSDAEAAEAESQETTKKAAEQGRTPKEGEGMIGENDDLPF